MVLPAFNFYINIFSLRWFMRHSSVCLTYCLLTYSGLSTAADSYNASTNVLTIPQVKVDGTLYSNVQVTVGTVVSVGSQPSADTYDTYTAASNQLRIPSVIVGSTQYDDVVITVGSIVGVGSSCTIASNCTKLTTPEIKGVLPGDSRISVMFNFIGAKITTSLSSTIAPATAYTAICTSSDGGVAGSSKLSVEYIDSIANYANPVVVSGLTNGKTYTCKIASTATGAMGASSSASAATIPNAGPANAAGVLSATVNTAHQAAYPNYASYCNYTNQSATGLSTPATVSHYNSSGTYTTGTSQASLSCSGTSTRTLSGNALPDHRASEFFTNGLTGYTGSPYFSGQPNSIASSTVSKTFPYSGTLSSAYTMGADGYDTSACYTYTKGVEPSRTSNNKWAAGPAVWQSGTLRCTWVAYAAYANNSVKIEPGTAETYTGSGTTFNVVGKNLYQDIGLDTSNAHNQPTGAPGSPTSLKYGDYHYHGIPEGHVARLGKGNSTMTLIAFAADGFPVYARYGYTNRTSTSGGVKIVKSNYRLRTAAELTAAGYTSRPASSVIPYGVFEQDWVYDATSSASPKGDLDACNGRFGVTPESPTTPVYHYYLTDSYPFIPRCLFGSPASWANS